MEKDLLSTTSVAEVTANAPHVPVLGHGIGSTDGTQRWVLYPNYPDFAPPASVVTMRAATANPWSGITSGTAFAEHVKNNWTALEPWRYVKSTSARYTGLSRLPDPSVIEKLLPEWPRPLVSILPQTDTGTNQIFSGNGAVIGYVFTRTPDDLRREEYWILLDSYEPPAGAAIINVGPFNSYAKFHPTFSNSWLAAGATFTLVITRCNYYRTPTELGMDW